MSVQFGKCNLDGKPVDPGDLDQVRPVLAQYGPDGEGCICKNNIGILYRAFHTTHESRSEVQPYVSKSGTVNTWDGRLDNRKELVALLTGELSGGSTDLAIIAAAYERWGTDSFAKLIGDWAISIWDPRTCSLVLAKDFVGTRHLYYSVEKNEVRWCTLLDPLVLFSKRSFGIEEEYIAGWLSFFPAPHLTPYVGIHSVPPSSFIRLARGSQKTNQYWDFDPAKRIRYGTDGEYEEHFRVAFAQSVHRRLRSDAPVLAELSGGMDSSSIVCMADDIASRGSAETPRLDTLSYYDDSEPNWNERPYFTKVEQKRAQVGCHVDVGSHQALGFGLDDRFLASPSFVAQYDRGTKQSAKWMMSQGSRTVLSGIGGDEVTGGVPTPLAELADLLTTVQLRTFVHQLKVWALNSRKPWFYPFIETIRAFLPITLVGVPKQMHPPSWLDSKFVARNRAALSGYPTRVKLLGALPSFQENIATLGNLRRQLGCLPLLSEPPRELRYPYLDRDLLEFIYAIPREQLLRPGHRRSLMRRALVGTVPDEILNRRRKAFVSRGALFELKAGWSDLTKFDGNLASSSVGIVDPTRFSNAVHDAQKGKETPVVPILRALALEFWLRSLLGPKNKPHHADQSPPGCCSDAQNDDGCLYNKIQLAEETKI